MWRFTEFQRKGKNTTLKNVLTFELKREDIFIQTNVHLDENKRSFSGLYQPTDLKANINQSIFVSSVNCPVTESIINPRTIKSCGTSG